jgi:hypothetical protein
MQVPPQKHALAFSIVLHVRGSELSQFNREYSRFFGQPSMRDIKSLRANAGVVA